jgi:hypothetical protein
VTPLERARAEVARLEAEDRKDPKHALASAASAYVTACRYPEESGTSDPKDTLGACAIAYAVAKGYRLADVAPQESKQVKAKEGLR